MEREEVEGGEGAIVPLNTEMCSLIVISKLKTLSCNS